MMDRRTLLRLALAASGAASGAGVLSSCASPSDDTAASAPSSAGGLQVDPKAPLEFFNFDGGYGKEWTTLPLDLYRKKYPDAQVKLTSGQQVQQQLQPRFVQGNPPDLIENVGLDVAALVSKGQVLEIGSLLTAPAFDAEGKTVADTLLPGAAKAGEYDGKKYAQPYVYGVGGIWYSKTLFAKHGWTYPKTWDEMLKQCAEIKKSTDIAPWTYQGKHPGYMTNPLLASAYKAGGPELALAVDNLEPNAWTHPAFLEAAKRFHEIAAKKYLLDGTTGLSHTQAQTYWAQRKAAFIPCGGWLENELGDIAPNDLGMTITPEPSLSASDKMPFETISGGPGGELIVPTKAKNPAGGLELLRILMSKEAARNFSKLTNSLTVVAGSADGLELTSAMKSMHEAITAAGPNIYPDWSFRTWYKKMLADSDNIMSAMMNLEITPEEWVKRMQKAADATAKDKTIKKFRR